MNKREFMTQFILNQTRVGILSSTECRIVCDNAGEAWETIMRVCASEPIQTSLGRNSTQTWPEVNTEKEEKEEKNNDYPRFKQF